MRMLSVGYLSVDCLSLIISGAPGMRPNLIKFVYYQYLSEMSFWKSGPKSGPLLKMLGPFAIRISVTVLIFSPWDKDCKKKMKIS